MLSMWNSFARNSNKEYGGTYVLPRFHQKWLSENWLRRGCRVAEILP